MQESKSVPGKFMIHRLLCLAAISVTTAPAFAQSVVSNRASNLATTAIENSTVPAPDGRTLVYASRRLLPAGPGKPLRPVTQLWRVIHTASGWSAPERLPD